MTFVYSDKAWLVYSQPINASGLIRMLEDTYVNSNINAVFITVSLLFKLLEYRLFLINFCSDLETMG